MKFVEDLAIPCPHCGRVNDLHGSLMQAERVPQPGCRSICWKCQGVSVFVEVDGVLTQRAATTDEAADADIVKAIAAMNRSRDPLEAYALFQSRR